MYRSSIIRATLPFIFFFTNGIVPAKAGRNPFLPSSWTSSSTTKSGNDNKYYQREDDEPQTFLGLGREFNIFSNRGGDTTSSPSPNMNIGGASTSTSTSPSSTSGQQPWSYRTGSGGDYYRKRKSTMASSSTRNSYYKSYYKRRPSTSSSSSSSNNKNNNRSMLSSLKQWVAGNNLPKIQCRVEPNTTLKVRKTFRPLKTIVQLGADFNAQLGVWQFKSSWEDDVIGGKLTLAGRELQFSKTWLLSVGAVEDLVTRLRLRAAVDLGTMKAYARLGFRTERLSPINVVEGFTMVKRLPLDGNDGHVKLEVKANFAFPEPEIEYSTENHRSFIGMGDIEINIDELNLLLDY